MAELSQWFSPSYQDARARFRAAVAAHPHLQDQGALPVVDDCTVDWAWTGTPNAQDALVYTSGLHGIEGYVGGAAQLVLLARGEDVPVLWLHGLNPWGMAHFRRVNESNVDLNRNFLPDGAAYQADDAAYAQLDALLNPPQPPGVDLFLARAAVNVMRHGMASLRNAVARGQYSFPRGIFYGGQRAEATTAVVRSFLTQQLATRRRVVHVDLHSARGPRGDYVAFLEGKGDPTVLARAQPVYGRRLRAWTAGSADGYEMRGGMLPELQRLLPNVRYDALTLEFGTRSDLAVVAALRAENQAFFYGQARQDHPARAAMRAAFYPNDAAWQARVVAHAPVLHQQAQQLLATG